ncbi:MAG: LPXTG cell wall anchor domain-containing protein [Streptococcus sp.]|nr:LPXTG cell wall anchor domain-containing protein [Streptococcus sp.]
MDSVYIPTVTPKEIVGSKETSEDIQGKAQKKTPTFTIDVDKNSDENTPDTVTPSVEYPAKLIDPKTGDKVDSYSVDGVGSYTIDPTTGEVTFQPLSSYTGTAPTAQVSLIAVVGHDKNGNAITATASGYYTPTVTSVTPTGTPKETTGEQGQTQTGKVEFKGGSDNTPIDEKVPATFEDGSTEKVVPGEGTYTVSPDGTVTFVPEKGFTGTGTGVTVVRKDTNGTPATAKYTPTVTPLTPIGADDKSSGEQGQTQTGTPTFKDGDGNTLTPSTDNPAKLIDPSTGQPAEATEITATKDGKTVGTYTIDPTTGVVTFTPNKDFVGTPDPANVQITDSNGTPATAKYTPTVTPVTPTGTPKETTGEQGQTQTGKVEFKGGSDNTPIDEKVPATFEDGSTEKVVPGEGTYTVSPDGTVTFVPEKGFTGTGTGVTVVRKDTNGTPATAKYTPTVTYVPTTSFVDGDGNVLSPIEKGTNPSKDIPGYTLTKTSTDKDGNVVYVYNKIPEKVTPKTSFVDGDGNPLSPVEDGSNPSKDIPGYELVKSVTDKDGNTVHTYKKVVKKTTSFVDGDGNPLSPVEDGTNPSKEIPGYTLTKTSTDKDGNVLYVYNKIPEKVTPKTSFVDGNVLYVYNKIPEKVTPKTSFVDGDGNPLSPVEDGTNPSKDIPGYTLTKTSTDKDGNVVYVYNKIPEKVTPKTSFVDGDGNPLSPVEDGSNPSKDIPGYELVKSVTDKDGNTVHTYKKVVKKTTSFVDGDGNPLSPVEDGTNPSKEIPGYTLTKTSTDKDGNVLYVYNKIPEKVTPKTSFVDGDGNPLSPVEDGSNPSKDIPGYELVKSVTDKDGNTVHTYKKVVKKTTSFVDGDGNPLSPVEDGSNPSKDIPGYELVKSNVDKDGNIIHVYKKVVKKTTSFVDGDGNPLSPVEDGSNPSKDIPGYELVKSNVDKDGNIIHVYKKVVKKTTSFVDGDGNPLSPVEDGSNPSKVIPGYEFVKSDVDKDGNVTQIYKKVEKQTSTEKMDKPKVPQIKEESKELSKPIVDQSTRMETLPNTGEESNTAAVSALGMAAVLGGFLGLAKKKRKED